MLVGDRRPTGLDGSPLWWPCSRAYATVSHAHRRAPRAPRSGLEHPVGGCRLRTAPSRLSPGSAHWRCTRPWATARALVQVAGLSLQYVTKLCILRDDRHESSVNSDTESPISEPLGFLRSARSMARLSLQWCVCVRVAGTLTKLDITRCPKLLDVGVVSGLTMLVELGARLC